jgi:hypothetical protein
MMTLVLLLVVMTVIGPQYAFRYAIGCATADCDLGGERPVRLFSWPESEAAKLLTQSHALSRKIDDS